jgi:hypothetical protein
MRTVYLLFLLLPLCLPAQTWTEVQPIDGDGNETVKALLAMPDGGYVAGGTFTGSSPFAGQDASMGGADLFLARYGADGALLWQLQAGDTENEGLAALAQLPGGDLMVAGSFWFHLPLGDTLLSTVGSPRALFLARLRTDGQLVWAQRISGDGLKEITGMKVLPDSSLAVAGYFQHSLTLGDSLLLNEAAPGSTSLFVAKLGSDGQWLWVQQAGDSGNTRVQALGVGPDGQIAVGGNLDGTATLAGTTLSGGFLNQNVFLAAFAPDGTPRWARTAGGVISDQLRALAVDEQGDIYAAGDITGVMNLSDTLSIASSTGNSDFFLLKYTAEGSPIWGRALGGPLLQQGLTLAVQQELVVVGGSFQGAIAFDGQAADAGSAGLPWGFLAGFRPDGQARWLVPVPADRIALVESLAFSGEEGLLAGGSFGQSATFDGQALFSQGNSSAFVGRLAPRFTTVRERPVPGLEYTVFPNPASHQLQVRPYTGQEQLRWFNANGQAIRVPGSQGQYELGGLPGGLYFIEVARSGQRQLIKVVVR